MLGTLNIRIANTKEINKALSDEIYNITNSSIIPTDADLNTYINPGKYVNISEENSINNLPNINELDKFILTVSSLSDTNLLQTLVDSNGRQASRFVILGEESNTFGDWIIDIIKKDYSIIGDGVTKSFKVENIFKTLNVVIQVIDSSGATVYVDTVRTSSEITITFATPPVQDETYTVVIL